MPSRNIEVVRGAIAAWGRGDLDEMLREYDPDVEIVDPERVGAGPFRGHEEFRRWIGEWWDSWDHYEAETEALVEVDDFVVLFLHHAGRAKGSGIELDQRGALLTRLRDGKVVLYRPYTHRADALEGAGLRDGEHWRVAIETILAGYEAWNRHDLDSLLKLLEPDMEFIPMEQSLMPAASGGREGVERLFTESAAVWQEFTFEPLGFTPIGDRLVVELRVTGTVSESSIEVAEQWVHLYTLKEGRLARLNAFRTRDEALEALAYPDA